MNYEIFLNKEDQRSYSLLRHLEESPTLSGTFIALREELSMSNLSNRGVQIDRKQSKKH